MRTVLKVLGWILFIWGVLLIPNIIMALLADELYLVPSIVVVSALLTWGGWKLAHPKPAPQPEPKYIRCVVCGFPNWAGYKYCTNCGSVMRKV